MSGEAIWLAAIAAMACGMPLGLTLGFAFVAHQRVRDGWRPRTSNRIALMFFGCAGPRDARELAIFCAGTLGLVALLFFTCAAPFLVAVAVPGDAPVTGAPIAAVFALAGLAGQSCGAKLCLRFVRAY